MKKFKDNGEHLVDLVPYRIVECPHCKKPVNFKNLTISCPHCGYSKEFPSLDESYPIAILTVPVKNFLEIPCCGEMLWAYNIEHLEFIEDYVNATLRTRKPNINKSLASRLPQWIKSKKNRDEVLKCIQRLKDTLEKNGYKRNVATT